MTTSGGRAITPSDLLLPPGARLLHIGPPKTGTTAIQGALTQARAAMTEHGVVYPGKDRQHYRAAMAIVGKTDPDIARDQALKPWFSLVKEVRRAGDNRVVISSEFFGESDDDTARTIVDGLGGDDLHVVVTLRPLVKLLPSAWQQYVRNRLRTPYRKWLDALFNPVPGVPVRTTFWRRHSHGDLVERWAGLLGPERVTVIMVDESNRTHLMQVFEQLTGLPEGFLVPEGGSGNRSLTHGETEVIRNLNVEFARRGWPDTVYQQVVQKGLVRALQDRTPDADEPRTQTPEWAIERASQRGAQDAARIKASGVRIVGDIDQLASPGAGAQVGPQVTAVLPAEAAAQGLLGVITRAAPGLPALLPAVPAPKLSGSAVPAPEVLALEPRVSDLDARALTSELARRVLSRFRKKARAVLRRRTRR